MIWARFHFGGELGEAFPREISAHMHVAPAKGDVLKIAGVTFHVMTVHHILHQYIGSDVLEDHEVEIYANRA